MFDPNDPDTKTAIQNAVDLALADLKAKNTELSQQNSGLTGELNSLKQKVDGIDLSAIQELLGTCSVRSLFNGT